MGHETGMYLVLESYQSQVKTHLLTPDALAHILVAICYCELFAKV